MAWLYIAAFCSTTAKICFNQILLTLAKALQLILYYSKIRSWHGRTTRTALTATARKTGQLDSDRISSPGPCLNAVTLSHFCPGGYHHHWSFLSSAHSQINSAYNYFIRRKQLQKNSMTVFKAPEQRQQYQLPLQLTFKSFLASAVSIMPVDREYKKKNLWWWHLQINPVSLSHAIASSFFGKGSFGTLRVVTV